MPTYKIKFYWNGEFISTEHLTKEEARQYWRHDHAEGYPHSFETWMHDMNALSNLHEGATL